MRRTTLFSLILLVPLLSSIFLLTLTSAVSTEFLWLTSNGDSMYPEIRDGDRVKVKLCTNGNMIEIGDIIVYCTIVTPVYKPKAMWIGHRVVEKYWKDGRWWFKTKGDNCPEPDSWKVPEYFLLGIVVDVIHTTNAKTEPSSHDSANIHDCQQTAVPVNPLGDIGNLILGLSIGLFLGLLANKCMHDSILKFLPLTSTLSSL